MRTAWGRPGKSILPSAAANFSVHGLTVQLVLSVAALAVIIGLQASARSPLSLRKKKPRRSTSISNRPLIGHMSVHIADKPFYKIRSARISRLRAVGEIPFMDGRSSVDAGKSVDGETGQVHAG